jgi:hypothetical protein
MGLTTPKGLNTRGSFVASCNKVKYKIGETTVRFRGPTRPQFALHCGPQKQQALNTFEAGPLHIGKPSDSGTLSAKADPGRLGLG